MNPKHFLIINPNAGGGKSLNKWKRSVKHRLQASGIQFEPVFTQHEGHAIELARTAVQQGYRHLIAMGGDGTIHEVMNGIMSQHSIATNEVTLSVIPVGTGNDWIRSMQISQNIFDAIDIIQNGTTYQQDIGLASYFSGNKQEERYFLNVAGMGFDAFVGHRLGANKRFGQLSYFFAIFDGLFNYKNMPLSIIMPTETIENQMFMVNIGIGQFFGGGMKITPHAVPNDGLFDITLVGNLTKLDIIKELRNLYTGDFLSNPKIDAFQTNNIHIQSSNKQDPTVYLQLDGELVGHAPVDFSLIPKALTVKLPANHSLQ